MHEATLVSGILRIAEEEARKHGASRIVAIRLELGLLACVEEQTLRACFEIFTEEGMARGARLDMGVVPLDCQCRACGHTFRLEKRRFACPACGDPEISFTGGHGCSIAAIEVASEETIHE